MSVNEMIKLANAIVKNEKIKMPPLKGWELDELIWWTKNLSNALI